MPQLDPSSYSSQLFWLILSFGLLYFMISRFILSDIGKVLRLRQDRIQGDIEAAEKAKDEAKRLKEEYENTVRKTRQIARDIVAKATQEQEAAAHKRHAELEKVLAEKLSGAEKKIRQAEKQAVETFTPLASSLATQIVKKLTGLEVKDKSASEIVNKLLRRV